MVIKRIVTDIAAQNVAEVAEFYTELFGLKTVMDQCWIVTLASGGASPVQLSIASEGGSGAPVPDMSIEVDEVGAVHEKAQVMDAEITYAMTDEPWGVRRFFLRDPAGKLVNILMHVD